MRNILTLCFSLVWLSLTQAAGIVQDFYVPLPEAQIYQANNTIVSGTGSAIFSTISIHVVSDNTVIYYDQWEDGYEPNLGSPTNKTTLIWGDGNDAHGIPPGMTHNPLGLPAGTIITLTNAVVTQPRNPAVLAYDGRDHIGATRPIVVTRAHWPTTTGTVIAGAVSVLSTAQWGTNYISPVGQNMTNGLMQYVGLFVQASQPGTMVTIDPTGTNGVGLTNIVLNQGESYLYNGGMLKGGKATANFPIQADLVIGHKSATYAVDWFNLYPVTSWGNTYYTPVGSAVNGQPAYVYLYNPNPTNVTINVTTKLGLSTVTLPATNVYQYTMPSSSGASFIGTNTAKFYAICTVNASPSADTTWNWGFSLVPTGILTTEEDLGWAPGSSDGSSDGSPVWVTPLNATKLYVVYGDSASSLTDPAGGKYSTNFSVSAYQSLKIYNPSKNQTGMRVYTLDGTLITAAWGEDADVAGAGNPYIDAGYTVLPFPVPTLKKSVANLTHPGVTAVINDQLQYTVTIANNNLVPLETIVLIDQPSGRLQYVAGSTTNYTSLSTNKIPDNTSAPFFPLSTPGYTNLLIQAQSSTAFTYIFTVTNVAGSITNQATIPAGVAGVSLTTSYIEPVAAGTAPVINFTDTNGVITNQYVVGLTNIYVTVTNAAANLSSNTVETIQVTVLDTITGDYETITLTETSTNSGVFRNISPLQTSTTSGLYANDGILHGAGGDPLSVAYIDATGASYSASSTLLGGSNGSGGGGGGGSSGTSFPLKQLYLNQATNGVTVTTNGLNRIDPVHYNFTSTLTTADLGSGAASLGTIGVDSVATNSPNGSNYVLVTHGGANSLILVGVSWAKLPGATGTGPASVTNVYDIIGGVTNLMTLVGTNLESGSGCAAIYARLNPATGTHTISVTASNLAAISTLVSGAICFSNVNQTAPFSITNKSGNVTSANPSNVVTTVAGDYVFDVVTIDAVAPTALGANQTKLYMGGGTSTREGGGASYRLANTATVTNSWTAVSDPWCDIAVSIQPAPASSAGGPSTNAVSFVQSPALATDFIMPSNGVVTVTNYIIVTNGVFAANPSVVLLLQTNGVTFLTLTNPTYNSGAGVKTNLVWSAVLTNSIRILAGNTITMVVSNGVAGTAFHINYGSSSYASEILLPASTVISIDSFGVYDAPYPGGNLVSGPVAGTALYVRATVSDPFGNYDITSLGLSITAPGGGIATANAVVVSTTTTNEVLEYAWTGDATVGNYSIAATANEGTEGITATATAALTTTYEDLGTPNTTTFTYGNNGVSTNTYLTNAGACLVVHDLSANTNSNTAETVYITVTSSAGGSIILPLFETGTNTGYFANCLSTTTVLSGTNSGTLYAPAGTILTANYTSVTSPSFSSSATALVVQPVGAAFAPAITLAKTIVSPTGGQILSGQPITYNLQVFNTGNTNLYNVAVTDSFPAHLTYTSATLTATLTNATSVSWTNIGTLTPGQSTNWQVAFTTTGSGSTTNMAWAQSSTAGTVASTNSAQINVNNPSVSVVKSVASPNATNAIGSTVVFTIVVANTGNTTITSLPVEDYFSGACFQYVSNNIVTTNAPAITGKLPSSGYGSLIWTNLAPTNGLAPGQVISNQVSLLVIGQGYPAYNNALVDYAVDTNGTTLPTSASTIGVTNAAASLSGSVYNDITATHTGVFTNGDAGLSGVTVTLYTTNGAFVATTTTAANGSYQFLNLPATNYVVVESLLAGFANSSPVSITTNLTALISYTNINFFAYLPAPATYGSISGSVTNDVNRDRVADTGDAGLGYVTINLVQDLNSNGLVNAGEPVVASTTTDTNGNYSFINLPPGRYVIQEAVPYGYFATNVTLGANSAGYLTATNASGLLTNFTVIGLNLTNGQNSVQNNFLLSQYQLSGNVYEDTNGLADNVVSGLGTNVAGTLYLNLLDAGSNVLATVAVAANGSYVFTNMVNGSYVLELSTNAGTVGSPAPAMALPAGWVNVGESTNGVIAGNTNGWLPVQLVTVLTNANFGLDQLPTSLATNASYNNPGGAGQVTVPALLGTDPEQGALGGATNTVVITMLPAFATLYYNGVAVQTGQAITNYTPSLLTLHPTFGGSGTTSFTFAIEDGANQQSAASATVNLSFTVNVSGTVFDDANGLTDGSVNGAATNATGVPLYVNLVNSGGNVVATTVVATNGAYQLTNLTNATYTLQLTTNLVSIGSAEPATGLPANWVNTGESTNGVSDGTPNGLLPINLVANITTANFGLDQAPTSLATNASYLNPGGTLKVTVPALLGTDPEQGPLGGLTNTVVIKSLATNATLYYNGVGVSLNQNILDYNPANLTLDPSFEGAGVVSFTFAIEDAAGQPSLAPATVTLTFTGLTLGGTVLDDTNGLSDGLVNGTGTNINGKLYANLISAGNVLTNVPVAANGSYNFTNLDSLTYTVQLTTNAGVIGAGQPATALPANWVNTGESTNTIIAGTPNGLLTLVLTTSVSTANFGVDQLPTILATNATYLNPGGTNQVVLPALLGTDPEQGALGGTTNRLQINTLPVGTGTLYYGGQPVIAGQIITNYNPGSLTLDPLFEGAGTVTFACSILDAAGESSAMPATNIFTFTGISLAGTVFNDTNGLTDSTVNGTGTNLGGALYVNLLGAASNVLASAAVAANGTYSFANISGGSDIVQLTVNAGTVGLAAPATALPAGWVNTGEFLGTGAGNDGNPNGMLSVNLSANTANADFGIWQLGSLAGEVVYDANGNGVQDASDTNGIGGVLITLKTNGVAAATTTTSASGAYQFTNLPAGAYTVVQTVPSGATATTSTSLAVTLASGQNSANNNFLDTGTGAIGGLVWYDLNGNGAQNSGEPDMSGVRVFVDVNGNGNWDGNEPYQITAANGSYDFTNLLAGTYSIVVDTNTLPPGVVCTHDRDGNNNGQTTIVLAAGQTVADATFGYQPFFSLGNQVYLDLNNDGNRDFAETNISGVRLVVFASDVSGNPTGSALATATTDAKGYYRFDGLVAGTYVVIVDQSNSPTLLGYVSSTGASTDYTLSGDELDHGKDTPISFGGVINGIISTPVTVGVGLQPTNELTSNQTLAGGHGPTGDINDNLVVDFSFTPTYSIGNRIFCDNGAGTGGIENNGIQDGTEPGISNVVVRLFASDVTGNPTSGILATTNSDVNGYYRFDGLVTGTYVVMVDQLISTNLAKLVSSTGYDTNVALADDLKDHGKDAPVTIPGVITNGILSVPVTVGVGLQPTGEATGSGAGAHGPTGDASDNLALNFGFAPAYSVGNLVFLDGNNDSMRDAGDSGIANVNVHIYAADGAGKPTGAILKETYTDSNGYYRFDGVAAGKYVVVVHVLGSGAALNGLQCSAMTSTDFSLAGDLHNHGNPTLLDSGSVLPGGIACAAFALGVGLEPVGEATGASGAATNGPAGDANDNLVVDFGFAPSSQFFSVGNRVFLDNGAGGGVANNGLQDGTEPGLTNVAMALFAANGSGNPVGTVLATTNTDVNGYYRFDNLPPGNYIVVVDVANSSSALTGLQSSHGASTNFTLADDKKDHGLDALVTVGGITGGISSAAFSLGSGLQPTGEATGAGAGANGPQGDANDNLTVNFGFAPSADFFSIGHRVFNDNGVGSGGIANNGIQDGSEPGISNVVMLIFQADASGNPTNAALASQTTDPNGYYRFDGMGPGTYVVVADQANSPTLATYLPSPIYTAATNTASQFENHALPALVTVNGAVTNGIASVPVTVGANLQPTGEQISGSGAGTQSPYGDSADNLTLNFGFTPTYSIGNWVFRDPDNDGRPELSRLDQVGITNVPMYIYAADGSGSPTGSALGNVRTDTNGDYRFDGLLAGTYVVVVDKLNAPKLNGYVAVTVMTTDNTLSGDSFNHGKHTPLGAGSVLPGGIASVPVTVGWGLQPTNEGVAPGLGGNGPAGDAFDNLVIDFGFTPVASLAGQVNVDVNGNGIADPADTAPIYPVVISVYDNTSTLVATVTNNSDGTYAVTNLSPGSYTVVETVPGGYSATSATSLPVTLTPSQNATGLNFLDSLPVTVQGRAWVDANGNGVQDLSEAGFAGVQVVLYSTNSGLGTLTAVTTNTTASGGAYSFSNLLPGNYVVGFGLPAGYILTQPYQGGNSTLDSNARPGDGLTEVLSPTTGQTISSVDAGYYQPANLSGNVFDDANGLSDGTVNGFGTNIQAALRINLLGNDGNVYATTPVAANGSFAFVNVPVASYTLQLTVNAGVAGQNPPATTLPSGWVNTGEYVGLSAGDDGTPNGLLAVNLAGNVANANFGIDQLPTSLSASTNCLNPGGTLTVPVPALTGTDPEQGPLGDGTNTVIVSVPGNGTLYYNGVAVTAGQVIPNYNSANLTLDPDFEGAGVVNFTFKIEDAAGQVSVAPATITINFTGLNISGNVYDDANGLSDLIVNGTGTNINGALYINLVDQGGTVLAHAMVQSDGSYGFASLSGGNVTLQLSTNAGVNGSAMPPSALPPGWVNTGENLGVGPGNDGGLPDGRLSVSLTNNVSDANYGIDQLPTSLAASTNYLNPGGTLTVPVPALTGVDPEEGNLGGGTNTVIVSVPANGTLYYQGVAVTAGEVIPNYDPANLTLDPAFEGAGVVAFDFEIEDAAGEASAVPATITINFTGVSLSGNVYDDLNGLADATVNGTGTNLNGSLYVNVINPRGTVLTNTAVLSDGSYLIPNLSAGNITLQLNTLAGVTGQAEPVTTLPTSWVNTGENLGAGAGDDGNPNGLLSITLSADQGDANFGIDQLPVGLTTNATYLNPGTTATVTVPALTGIDPEQGPLGGNTNTVVIVTIPGNGTLYYNGVPVTAGQVIPDYDPSLLTFDPNYSGAGTSSFTFAIQDAAGQASLVPAGVTLTFTGLTLGGSVFDDANGLTDGLVNGTGTNINGVLFANLIASGNVLASLPVASDGSYSFTNLDSLTYTVQLSTSAGSVGLGQPTTTLPAGWTNVGESTNGVSDGNPNGLLTVALTSSVTANFGIDQLPASLATNASYLNPGTTSTVTVPALLGTDPEQGPLGGSTNTVVIVTLPDNGTLYYSGAVVTAGQTIPNYNPAQLTLDPTFEGAGVVDFNFMIEDAAGQPSTAPASVTLTFTALALSGTVFNDTNGLADGLVDGIATNATETPLYVNLSDLSSNVVASMLVGNDGSYSFTNLSGETYIAQLSLNAGTPGSAMPATSLPDGWVNTGESTNNVPDGNPDGLLTLTLITSISDVNFGVAQAVTIGDYTWLDVNDNGIQDPGEPSLGGVTVVLFQTNTLTQTMTAVATNLSAPNGSYFFTNLPPGTYQLQFIAPGSGYTFSPAFQGSDPAKNSHADAATGHTGILNYSPGTIDLNENAGFLPDPTAVSEVGLQASVESGQIWLTWQTYSEAGLLAFDVTRTAPNGVVADVTPDYVFASGQDVGASYSVLDAGATLGGNYTYQLYGYYNDLSIGLLATATVRLTTSAVPAPSQPSLSIKITGSGIRLDWTGGQSPYVVEQSTSLGAGAVWQVVEPATTNMDLTVPLTGLSSFFRIRGN